MSSHELITSKYLPLPPESPDPAGLPDPETRQSPASSLDRFNRWGSWGIAVVLFVVGGSWGYSYYLDTKSEAAQKQSLAKPSNPFSLSLWATGSKRDQDEAQKQFQRNFQRIQDANLANVKWDLEEQTRRTQQQFKSAFEKCQQPQSRPIRSQQGQQQRRLP